MGNPAFSVVEWGRRVEACRNSGQRVSEWCAGHGIPVSTYISVSPDDYSVHWSGSAIDGFHYSEIERLAKNGNLRCVDDVLYWEYPTEIFNAFKDIYILTYLFQSTMLSSYMDIYGFPYVKMSAKLAEDGNHHLCQYSVSAGAIL